MLRWTWILWFIVAVGNGEDVQQRLRAAAGHRAQQQVHRSEQVHPKERTCSKRMGVTTDQEPCVTVQVRFGGGKFTGASLVQELGDVDANFLIRRIHIITTETDPLAIHTALDVFLETRPWWIIRKDVIQGLEHEVSGGGGGAGAGGSNASAESTLPTFLPVGGGGGVGAGPGGHASHKFSHVFLQRYEAKMETHLHQIAAVQYPPAQECATSRMRLSHTVNSGWGSASAFYGIFVSDYPWAVFAPWESNTNRASESIMYASASMCPTVVNKWTCAFLPATNCSFPDAVTKCGLDGQPACNWDGDLLYSSATPEGKRAAEEDKKKWGVPGSGVSDGKGGSHSPYHSQINSWYAPHQPDSFISEEPVLDQAKKQVPMRAADKWLVAKVFGQLWRPNAVYRVLIAQRIKQMWKDMWEKHQLPPLSEEKPCTAIHIRRGDRSMNLEGPEMRKWCQQWLPFKSWDNCTSNVDGHTQACQGLSDLGCFGKNPFGALLLQDYLDAAWSLQETRNVFVLTDASSWLEQQRALIGKEWNVYSIASAGSKDRDSNSQRATMNGVEFHASLRVAQMCSSFVGHWGSGVTHMVRNAMCWRHGNTLASCPKIIDLQ